LTLSVFEYESRKKYENKYNISDIRLYPICSFIIVANNDGTAVRACSLVRNVMAKNIIRLFIMREKHYWLL
jgi:hypothetical protein